MGNHLRLAGKNHDTQLAALKAIIAAEPVLMAALRVAQRLDLPDWLLVSGAIYNSAWNALTGRPSMTGVKDIDLFYCDPSDLSYEAEDAVIRRAAPYFEGLPVPVEIRNQARVHLWYESHFGTSCTPIFSSREAVTRFASITHMVGARLNKDDGLDIYAPYGLDAIFSFRLVPNRATDNRQTHEAKAARAIGIWPELQVDPW